MVSSHYTNYPKEWVWEIGGGDTKFTYSMKLVSL